MAGTLNPSQGDTCAICTGEKEVKHIRYAFIASAETSTCMSRLSNGRRVVGYFMIKKCFPLLPQ